MCIRDRSAADKLNVNSAELLAGIDKKDAELTEAKAETASLQEKVLASMEPELAAKADGDKLLQRLDGISRDGVAQLARKLATRDELSVVVLGGEADGGGAVLVAASSDAAVSAGELIAAGSSAIQGGGGKGKDFAMAGGKNPAGVDEALDLIRGALK